MDISENKAQPEMTPEDMLSYRRRFEKKVQEMKLAMKTLEEKYVKQRCPLVVGDPYQTGTALTKGKMPKEVPVFGIIDSVSVDYDAFNTPKIKLVINNEKGRYVKTIYMD